MMEFVDFVLAWDHRSHPAALPYFFSIFDLQHRVSGAPGRNGTAARAAGVGLGRYLCTAMCAVQQHVQGSTRGPSCTAC
jgi:hypothetical protein